MSKYITLSSRLICFTSLFLLLSINPGLVSNAETISRGTTLPSFEMEVPASPEGRSYLGLNESKQFSLSDVQSRLIVFEVFSVLCTVCPKQAPNLNRLYSIIEADPVLKKDIKFIGLGAGDSEKKVTAFGQTYHVPFPLIPDPQRIVHKKIGRPGTPTTMILDKSGKVLYAHLGQTDNFEELLATLKGLYLKAK